MRDVYFIVNHDEFEDGDKLDWAIVIEKEFWDQCKGFDDTMNEDIEDALAGIVSLDSPETVSWEPDAVSLEDITNRMKDKGFNLLINDPIFIDEYIQEYGEHPQNTIIR